MTHPRINIRTAVAEHLKQTFANTYTSRSKPLFDQDLPAVLVYTGTETIKEERWDTDGHGDLIRELELFVEAVDTGKDDLDDKLDTMAEQIENMLDGWNVPKMRNAVLRFKTTETDMSIDGAKIYGAIRLGFTLTYMTKTHNNDD